MPLDRRIVKAAVIALVKTPGVAPELWVRINGLESARENQHVAADRYREGLIPSSELLDAEVGLLRSGLDLTDALAQARLAAAGLDRALGK